jgi:single-strand DNA-binding protein
MQLAGNLTADPEFRYTQSGAVANFRVACNPRRYDRSASRWVDGTANYFNVQVWGFQAGNVAESLTKGDRVLVLGTIRTETWMPQDGGQERSAQVVVANEVGASLRHATALCSTERGTWAIHAYKE